MKNSKNSSSDNEVLFSESQKFRQWWLWSLLVVVNVYLVYGAFNQVMNGVQFGKNSVSDSGVILLVGGILALSILILYLRLETVIRHDGIYVRFFPFHFKYKFYAWNELKKSYVRQYSPLFEYGGYGYRIGVFGSGGAYNVSGNKGIQLEFQDNKKLLIGSNKSDELQKVLSQMGQVKY
ncbi:MAG: hypothetical protein ACRCVT_16220 [Leadbetterella sp.]